MNKKLSLAVALISISTAAVAFELTGTRYVEQTLEYQLGDLCDSVRFPLTPGTCAGSGSDPDWQADF